MRILPLILVAGASVICCGCSDLFTTSEIRQHANTLAVEVSQYRQQQQERIARIHADYRNTYNRLSDQLTMQGQEELSQSYVLDAIRYSDQLIADPDSLLPGRFRDALQNRAAAQVAKIDVVDAEIASARNAYADSYKDVSLNLARLKSVEGNLATLAQSEKETNDIQALIQKIYNAYQAVQKREKQAGKSGTSSSAGS